MNRNRISVIILTMAGGFLLAILTIGVSSSHAAFSAKPVTLEVDRCSLTATELQTASKTSLLIATSPDYWPMEYITGTQIVGHDIDLMNAIATEMSVTVVYTNVLYSHIFDGLIAGKYDAIISSVTISPGREKDVDFTLPYVTLNDLPGGDNLGIAVHLGNYTLRYQINEALRKLRADGTLQSIITAIAADKPVWQPRLPVWPYGYLPLILRN
jgi:ABC-type amino acid transport substrate-binding protein